MSVRSPFSRRAETFVSNHSARLPGYIVCIQVINRVWFCDDGTILHSDGRAFLTGLIELDDGRDNRGSVSWSSFFGLRPNGRDSEGRGSGGVRSPVPRAPEGSGDAPASAPEGNG